jgi:hypothetical protein
LVIHHVSSRNIKPKNGVYHIGGKSVQWGLIRTAWEDFDAGIRDMHNLFLILEKGTWADGRVYTSSAEEVRWQVEVCQGCF